MNTKKTSPIHPNAEKLVVFTISRTFWTNSCHCAGICVNHSIVETDAISSAPIPKPLTSAKPTARIGTSEVSVTNVSDDAWIVRSSSR